VEPVIILYVGSRSTATRSSWFLYLPGSRSLAPCSALDAGRRIPRASSRAAKLFLVADSPITVLAHGQRRVHAARDAHALGIGFRSFQLGDPSRPLPRRSAAHERASGVAFPAVVKAISARVKNN
jgi:hypothetical protein